ncbi:MAG: hypothetical protein ABFR90_11695 [Planctomycetota bacterium]
MTPFIIIFGTLTCLAGIVILVNPEIIFGFLRKNYAKIELQILAVTIRLVLGAFLIYQAGISKYPFVIEIIGWLSIVAAVFFAVIGRNNFSRLMVWALSQVKTLGRVGGVIASVFGAFLVHAFI